MGLIELFISNVFDTYPTQQFVESFLDQNQLDLNKILTHNFLKQSLVFSYVWKYIYQTYPTKRDFINIINMLKIVPEACNNYGDKSYIEKILNSFMPMKLGGIKYINSTNLYNDVKNYIADLDNINFVEDELVKKFNFRFNCSIPKITNILITFVNIYKEYSPPNLYTYQINPISNNFNENVLFNNFDNDYLNEFEKIQYTIYKDNHFLLKFIDNCGILFDIQLPTDILINLLDIIKDKNTILLNCDYVHDKTFCFQVDNKIKHLLPSLFSNFIYVSDKQYPNYKSLGIKRDNSIYYLYTKNIIPNEDKYTTTYDRYIVNNLDNYNINVKLKVYIILDYSPVITDNIIWGPTTYANHKDLVLPPDTKFVIDFYDELDLLPYMANKMIPIVNKESRYVKNLITGIVANTPIDNVLIQNIQNNLKYFHIITHKSMFDYYWKQHLSLSCQYRSVNSRNGLLIYLNFVYLYFFKRLENIIGLEDKNSRSQNYKVVLIDNRPNILSVISVLFTLANLNIMWSCQIYTSKDAMPYYEDLLGDLVEVIHYPELDVKKFHIDIYNNILKSTDFWKSIQSYKTLIIQDDGILLRPGIDKFMNFDYIGASWVDNVANEYIKSNISEELVGNGGFSLRTTDAMIKVCENFIKEKQWLFYKNLTQIPEDVYFIYGLKQLKVYNLPNYKLGMEFASEEISNHSSLGTHKIWAYHMGEVTQNFFDSIL
jgi:hypothetical protein